nr:subclass B3 metallo-beta-lactamase [uncultured Sphingomonas sp.]
MFASLIAIALAGQQISIPLGPKPVVHEKPKAPIEESGPQWAAACKDWDEWDTPAPPVRIHGNSYLVGTCGISAILIVGDEGDILIDSGTEKGSDVVLANIRALGFKPKDIRIILASHEHIDHVGGISVLQQASGARLYASPTAAKVFETGAATPDDPQAGEHPAIRAARVDRIIKDGEEIRLGNLMVKAIATPGHTPGAMSYRWVACDGGVCPTIVYADSMSPVSRNGYRFSDHPDYLAAYRAAIAKVASSPCDILITPHPSASDMRARMLGEKPWRDDDGCKAYADAVSKKLDERLAKEADPAETGK